MTASEATSATAATKGLLLSLTGLLLLGGCITADVRTTASPEADFGRYASVRVAGLVVDETALGLPPLLIERLQSTIGRSVAERGYVVEDEGQADLRIEVRFAVEQVSRRTWDSDPDASAPVLRELDEAVADLRVVDPVARREIFRAEARSRLRVPDPIIGPSSEKVWLRLAEEAAARVPRAASEVKEGGSRG